MSNVGKCGYLYTWEGAKRACPPGWRLPSKEDFEELLDYVGEDNQTRSQNLRATTWSSGADKYAFGALPGSNYSA